MLRPPPITKTKGQKLSAEHCAIFFLTETPWKARRAVYTDSSKDCAPSFQQSVGVSASGPPQIKTSDLSLCEFNILLYSALPHQMELISSLMPPSVCIDCTADNIIVTQEFLWEIPASDYRSKI